MECFVIDWSVLLQSVVFCYRLECFVTHYRVECLVTEWSVLL